MTEEEMTEGEVHANPAAAVLDLVSAQEALTAAVADMVATQREIVAAIAEQAEAQREQTAATKVLHAGVRRLVAVVVVGIVVAVVVGITLLLMGQSLVDIARTNRNNGEATVQNGADIKATLERVESVTGPDAQKRQAASTVDILRRVAIETDCRSRRQQARLPAPDPLADCASQTDPSVYPGVLGEPARLATDR